MQNEIAKGQKLLLQGKHIVLRELPRHKLSLNGLIVRLLELWRTTIREIKVSLGNNSKVSGVFFVTQLYITML